MTILLDALGAFIQAGKSAKSQRALVVTAFPIEDFAKDLKKFDVPTLILHGDDDPIVRIGASALLSSKLVKGATLKVIPGAPHGMCSTLKDQLNDELLTFFGRSVQAAT